MITIDKIHTSSTLQFDPEDPRAFYVISNRRLRIIKWTHNVITRQDRLHVAETV